jgi:hypothetical protein
LNHRYRTKAANDTLSSALRDGPLHLTPAQHGNLLHCFMCRPKCDPYAVMKYWHYVLDEGFPVFGPIWALPATLTFSVPVGHHSYRVACVLGQRSSMGHLQCSRLLIPGLTLGPPVGVLALNTRDPVGVLALNNTQANNSEWPQFPPWLNQGQNCGNCDACIGSNSNGSNSRLQGFRASGVRGFRGFRGSGASQPGRNQKRCAEHP